MLVSEQRLVDKVVLPFSEWKAELQKEDLQEVGAVVNRPIGSYGKLYDIYRKFQTRVDVVEFRKEMVKT